MKTAIFFIAFLISFSQSKENNLNSFISDAVSYFGYDGIQIYLEKTLDDDLKLTKMYLELWSKDAYVSIFDENSYDDPIFVLNENEPALTEVEYDHNQIWFMDINNLEHISHWKLRLDSLVYLWKEVNDCEIEIRVRKNVFAFSSDIYDFYNRNYMQSKMATESQIIS